MLTKLFVERLLKKIVYGDFRVGKRSYKETTQNFNISTQYLENICPEYLEHVANQWAKWYLLIKKEQIITKQSDSAMSNEGANGVRLELNWLQSWSIDMFFLTKSIFSSIFSSMVKKCSSLKNWSPISNMF